MSTFEDRAVEELLPGIHHPWTGMYTMEVYGLPTNAVWFKNSDDDKPNFFMEATAFRPQMNMTFPLRRKFQVYVYFRKTRDGYNLIEKVASGNEGTRGIFFYPRHTKIVLN